MRKVIHSKKILGGHHTILNRDDPLNKTMMGFSVLNIKEKYKSRTDGETAFVLLSGKGNFAFDSQDLEIERKSVFNENPYTFLLPPNYEFEITPEDKLKFAVISSKNKGNDAAKTFMPEEILAEKRGQNILDNTSCRIVKTIFDYSIMPESNLVIGEVINQQGRWSSYPPHHHRQPEIYFYQFLPEQGYGFSQLGDDVMKVKHNSLSIIENNKDHPQVAAPGYAMWYLWAIHHLPNNPYRGFEFDLKHEWTLKKDAKILFLDDIK